MFHQVASLVEGFETGTVLVDVFASREPVKSHQRIHVVTARSRTILDALCHQIDVGIEFEVVVEEAGGFAKVEIMLLHLVVFDDAPSRSVGIREIALHLLVAGCERQGVDSGQTVAEEVAHVVVTGQGGFRTPAGLCFAIHAVVILEPGETHGMVDRQARREGDALHILLSFSGSDQDHAISGLRSI